MDAESFDRLTRVFGAGSSRRRALAVLAGLGLAARGGASLAAPAACNPSAAKRCVDLAVAAHHANIAACRAQNPPGSARTACLAAEDAAYRAELAVCPSARGCCPAGSICENQCAGTSNPNCQCGTTFDGGVSVCYQSENGCAGHGCDLDGDCVADYGPSATCIYGYCSTPNVYCATSADCGTGSVCVDLNDGCGGCDNYTGGTLGICQPICTG